MGEFVDTREALPLSRESVQKAHKIVQTFVHRTPTVTSQTLNKIASTPQTSEALKGTEWEGRRPANPTIRFFFKAENLQKIGAFKARGAFHALSRLPEETRNKGVVTHSSGNHAQATALAAKTFGVEAHIIMPTVSTPSKIASTQSLGANVYFSGSTSDEREALVEEVLRKFPGATLVPPYNHPDIILGQGTLGLELEQQVEELGSKLDAVIGPCGGGGMLSGVAVALSGTGVQVFGAEPSYQDANDAQRGLARGERITKVKTFTIADGLRTPLGDITWSVISDKEKVKGVFSVTEQQIKDAMRLFIERVKLFVEPSAVVGLAVALYNEDFRNLVEARAGAAGWNVGIVVTGGNTTIDAVVKLFGSEI